MACRSSLQSRLFLALLVSLANAASYLRKSEDLELVAQQRAAAPHHRLQVCNAYPYQTNLTAFIGDTQLTDPPMAYKECREFEQQLHTGDHIDFRFLESSAGDFVVKELPASDAVLMLVIYRHGVDTTQVAFESHVFANLLNAQIAVLDTYKGPEKGEMKIQDLQEVDTARSEALSPNTVVAVNAGKYEVVLYGSDGTTKARSDLAVENGDSCVVIRCGVQPKVGRAYPEEIIVFPAKPSPPAESSEVTTTKAGYVPGRRSTKMESEADRRAHMPKSAPVAAFVAISFGIIVVGLFAAFTLW